MMTHLRYNFGKTTRNKAGKAGKEQRKASLNRWSNQGERNI